MRRTRASSRLVFSDCYPAKLRNLRPAPVAPYRPPGPDGSRGAISFAAFETVRPRAAFRSHPKRPRWTYDSAPYRQPARGYLNWSGADRWLSAAQRVAAMLDKGDLEGKLVWLKVLRGGEGVAGSGDDRRGALRAKKSPIRHRLVPKKLPEYLPSRRETAEKLTSPWGDSNPCFRRERPVSRFNGDGIFAVSLRSTAGGALWVPGLQRPQRAILLTH